MNLLSLKYFIAVAESGSFTKAAERLFVSQPTLSRQIASLEDELGVQLFQRNKNAVVLTEAGRILLDEGHEILKRCDSLTERIRQTKLDVRGTLRIGYHGSFDNSLLGDALKALSSRHPYLDFSLVNCNFGELNRLLMEGDVDVIFTSAVCLHSMPNIEWTRVQDNTLQVVVPSEHFLANQDAVCIRELASENFIMLERSAAPLIVDYVVDLCLRNGFSPNITIYVRDTQTGIYMVGAGKGVGFLFSQIPVHHFKNVKVLRIVDCDINFDIVVAHRTDNTNPLVPFFLSVLNNLCCQHPS